MTMILLRVSAVLTLVGLALMVWSMLVPTPLPVMLAMTVGQGLGTIAFGLYLFVVVRELRTRVLGAAQGARQVKTRVAAACVLGRSARRARRRRSARLRADALATTAAPAGLLTLAADGDAGRTVSAEAVVWTGRTGSTAGDRADGDVLVIALHARTADGRASGTLGRFVATLGALRPVHVDGARGRAAPAATASIVEAYAGMPVLPDLDDRAHVGLGRRRPRVARGSATGARSASRISSSATTAGSRPRRSASTRGAALGKRDDVAARSSPTISRTRGSPRRR